MPKIKHVCIFAELGPERRIQEGRVNSHVINKTVSRDAVSIDMANDAAAITIP